MIENKKKPVAGGGVATGSKQNNLQMENIIAAQEHQEKINHDAVLSDVLKSYKHGLLASPYCKHISRLVDCCDLILDEVWGG